MALITYVDKSQEENYDPEFWNSQDANEIKTVVNINAAALDAKADKINGTVPLAQLPPVYFSGVSGTGTQNDPYVVSGSGGQASAENYLKSLAGYSEIEDKVLYVNSGIFSWGAVPSGSLEKLTTPALTIGTAQVDSFPLSWNAIANATSYTLQRDSDISFGTVTTLYNGALRTYTDTGLAANATYYYRLRANGAGFAPSDYTVQSGTTLEAGNITPPSPTNAVIDDTADTFNWTNATGYANISNYEFTLDGGSTYAQATVKPLQIGNIAKAVGTVGVRVKADTGRNASGTLYNGIAFNTAAVKASKPTNPVNDDLNDTFDWTNVSGFTLPYQYEYTLNSGSTYKTATEKPIYVGDFNKAIGTVGVRVKAATGVLASDTLYNTVAFTGTDGLVPITQWLRVEDFILTGNTLTGAELGGAVSRARSAAYIPSGATGSVQFTGYGRIGLDEGATEDNYSAQFNYGCFINSANSALNPSSGTSFFSGGFVSVPAGITPMVRIRVDATTVYFAYSLTNAASWVENSAHNRARTGGDLYIKADGGYDKLDSLNNILGSGILINGSLS